MGKYLNLCQLHLWAIIYIVKIIVLRIRQNRKACFSNFATNINLC